MLKIDQKSNKIELTRGDTAKIKLELKDSSGEQYTPGANDVIRLAVKKTFLDESVLFSVEAVTSGEDVVITILPSHTKSLDFGTYRYDIQLTTGTGANAVVDTIVPKGTLVISEEID